MSTQKIITVGLLSGILAAGAFAAIGSFTSMAIAQSSNGLHGNNTSSAGNTDTASGNMTTISGAIASLQNNDQGAPAWITGGHWQLESDGPLFGNDTEPRVSNFSAMIYMTSIANGTNTHKHEITDFMQTEVLHSGQNVTTINGTMTITMADGPHQNASGYVTLENDMISIWIDPTEIDDHFGPTPVYGMILPDRLKSDDHDDWQDGGTATAADGGNMTMGAGHDNSTYRGR